MKKKIAISILLLTNLVTAVSLVCVAYQRSLWRAEAMRTVNFTAQISAINDFDKGKQIKLNLVIKDEAEGYKPEPTKFEGEYVLRDWTGYIYPYLSEENSPNVLMAREFVESYNAEMAEIVSDPDAYEDQRQREIAYWQEKVLSQPKEEPGGE